MSFNPRPRQLAAIDATVQAWIDHGEGRKTIAFGVQVQHAYALATEFQRRGITAGVVHGELSDDERAPLYAAMRDGRGWVRVLDAKEVGL